jgi:hypothetical protein
MKVKLDNFSVNSGDNVVKAKLCEHWSVNRINKEQRIDDICTDLNLQQGVYRIRTICPLSPTNNHFKTDSLTSVAVDRRTST